VSYAGNDRKLGAVDVGGCIAPGLHGYEQILRPVKDHRRRPDRLEFFAPVLQSRKQRRGALPGLASRTIGAFHCPFDKLPKDRNVCWMARTSNRLQNLDLTLDIAILVVSRTRRRDLRQPLGLCDDRQPWFSVRGPDRLQRQCAFPDGRSPRSARSCRPSQLEPEIFRRSGESSLTLCAIHDTFNYCMSHSVRSSIFWPKSADVRVRRNS